MNYEKLQFEREIIDVVRSSYIFKMTFLRTLFLTTTNAMVYSSTFLRTTITNL
jgi:hypothetical protein